MCGFDVHSEDQRASPVFKPGKTVIGLTHLTEPLESSRKHYEETSCSAFENLDNPGSELSG